MARIPHYNQNGVEIGYELTEHDCYYGKKPTEDSYWACPGPRGGGWSLDKGNLEKMVVKNIKIFDTTAKIVYSTTVENFKEKSVLIKYAKYGPQYALNKAYFTQGKPIEKPKPPEKPMTPDEWFNSL